MEVNRRQSRQALRLFVAEDNLADALLIEEAFSGAGYDLVADVFSDGAAALIHLRQIVAQSATRPDAILLDLNLPKVAGFEVLEEIRRLESLSAIPVIVMTSSDAPADKERARRLNASYFRKPNTYGEFLRITAILEELLDKER